MMEENFSAPSRANPRIFVSSRNACSVVYLPSPTASSRFLSTRFCTAPATSANVTDPVPLSRL